MNLSYEALATILASLTPERRASVHKITELLVLLRLPRASVDAVLAAIILEVAETQFVEDGGSVPPVRDSAIDVLRPLFEAKTSKKN